MPALLASIATTNLASCHAFGITKIGAKIMRALSVSKADLVASVCTTLPGKCLRHISVSGATQSENW